MSRFVRHASRGRIRPLGCAPGIFRESRLFFLFAVDTRGKNGRFNFSFIAGVAQLVEHHLAKVDVDSSNLFARSIFF